MVATYVLSSCFFLLYLNARWLWDQDHPFLNSWHQGWIFWSLNERYSAVIAFAIIAITWRSTFCSCSRFSAMPQDIFVRRPETCWSGARSGKRRSIRSTPCTNGAANDRIVIVAHSLGTVVAYDMLRAYFSRINNKLPDSALLEPLFSAIDGHDPNHPAGEIKTDTDFRTAGRELVQEDRRSNRQ